METIKPSVPEALQVSAGNDKERPFTTREFVPEHANDPYCMKMASTLGKPVFIYLYGMNGVLIRQSRTDGPVKKIVHRSLRAQILYLANYPALSGHPVERRLYDTVRGKYYWSHKANNAYLTEPTVRLAQHRVQNPSSEANTRACSC